MRSVGSKQIKGPSVFIKCIYPKTQRLRESVGSEENQKQQQLEDGKAQKPLLEEGAPRLHSPKSVYFPWRGWERVGSLAGCAGLCGATALFPGGSATRTRENPPFQMVLSSR